MRSTEQLTAALAMASRVWWRHKTRLPKIYATGSGVYAAALCKFAGVALQCIEHSPTETMAEQKLNEVLQSALKVWSDNTSLFGTPYDSEQHGRALAIAELCENRLG